MKKVLALIPLMLTAAAVYWLDKPAGELPSIGRLLDPVAGFWANAEPKDKDFYAKLSFDELSEKATVWFDDRLVPHIHAENDHDLYFIQGYIHAGFRLWQMDLQTRAAAGRISELLGEKAINYDKGQRRKGMVYGAERCLKVMESDPRIKVVLDAYRDGINAYISQLTYADYPVEYKLMSFKPEKWDNLRTALLLMYLSDDLTGETNDIALTYYRQLGLSPQQLDFFFPEKIMGSKPVVPAGTIFTAPSMEIPPTPDSPFAKIRFRGQPVAEDQTGKGSNNWAVSGSRTLTGKPILCNDPHLALNLPSIWYEMQLTAPGVNVYGVSLPGAPGVLIGFNDNIAWGFTNNYRDVKDFYAIDELNDKEYMFNGSARKFEVRSETIKVKGKAGVVERIRFTVHGPLIYDKEHVSPDSTTEPLALRWMAYDAGTELLSLYLLNRATNYTDYRAAAAYFRCPGQNFIYADTKNNIAITGQGQFVNKWPGQGKFVMRGTDSSTLWASNIPMAENPAVLNPGQGYLVSANQSVTDTTYPYWYNGKFDEFRAWRINEVLDTMRIARAEDMFLLQNDVHSVLARNVLP